MKYQIKIELIGACINKDMPPHMNWFTLHISGVPRSVMVEFNRHRSISTSQESSRYTLKKHLKGKAEELHEATDEDSIWGKYLWLVEDRHIDEDAHEALGALVYHIEHGKSNDDVKTLIPEGLLYKGVYTMTLEAWEHLYSLRSGKEVYGPFRDLVESIKEKLESTQLGAVNNPMMIAHSHVYSSSHACRTCWDSVDKHDHGEKDLELIKRVGVKFKHRSVIEHLIIRTNNVDMGFHGELVHNRHYRKYIDECTHDGNTVLLINMRTVLECLEDKNFTNKKELLDVVPNDYKFLVEDLSEPAEEVYLSREVLDSALEWFQDEATDVEVKKVGTNDGFDYETLAIVAGDELLIEISKNEIEYRAELME